MKCLKINDPFYHRMGKILIPIHFDAGSLQNLQGRHALAELKFYPGQRIIQVFSGSLRLLPDYCPNAEMV